MSTDTIPSLPTLTEQTEQFSSILADFVSCLKNEKDVVVNQKFKLPKGISIITLLNNYIKQHPEDIKVISHFMKFKECYNHKRTFDAYNLVLRFRSGGKEFKLSEHNIFRPHHVPLDQILIFIKTFSKYISPRIMIRISDIREPSESDAYNSFLYHHLDHSEILSALEHEFLGSNWDWVVFGRMSFYRYFIENKYQSNVDCPWTIEFRNKLRAIICNERAQEILKYYSKHDRVRDFFAFLYYGNDNKQ